VSYVTHARAALNPAGRLKIVQLVVNDGWAQARVADRFQVARGTVSKWVARYRAEGELELSETFHPCSILGPARFTVSVHGSVDPPTKNEVSRCPGCCAWNLQRDSGDHATFWRHIEAAREHSPDGRPLLRRKNRLGVRGVAD
jgi:transposase-like protein